MPRKPTPAKVLADRFATIVTVLGMLLAGAGEGYLRVIGLVTVVVTVLWFCTTGMYLQGTVEQDDPRDRS